MSRGEPAKRRGRPPIDEPRSRRVQVRYTDAEYAALAALAKHNDETISDLVRRLTTRQLELVT